MNVSKPSAPLIRAGSVLFGGLLLAALVLFADGRSALARPGDLDETFNNGGTVTTDFGGADEARGIWLDGDGNSVVAGVSNAGTSRFMFALARYTPDGQLDTGFGRNGRVTTPVGSGDAVAMAVVVRRDSKMVVAGYADAGGATDFALARYNADGTLDTSFGDNGITITPVSSGNDLARDITIDDEARLVVAGTSGGQNLVLARYSSDGVLDTSFGEDGIVSVPLADLGIFDVSEEAFELVIQQDGTVVAIVANGRFQVIWYSEGEFEVNIDAPLAPGFDRANGLFAIPGGLVAIAGVSGGRFAVGVYRYTGNVTEPETSFGNGGITVTDFGRGESVARSLTMRVDRKIVAVGRAGDAATGDFAVARYQALPEPEPTPSATPAPEPMTRQTPAPTPAPTPVPTARPTTAPSSAVPPNTIYRGGDRNGYIAIEFLTNSDGTRIVGEVRSLRDIPCGNNRVVTGGGAVTFDFAVQPNGVAFGSTPTGTVLTLDLRIQGTVATGTFTYTNPSGPTPCDTGRINFEARAVGR
jgi:uncharacterized delta-60 repeat protein